MILACQLVNSVSRWQGIGDFVVFFIFFCISHFRLVQAPRFYLTHLRDQCIDPNRSADKLKGFAYFLALLPDSICICTIMYLHSLPTPAASCYCIGTKMYLHILLTQVSNIGETISISLCVSVRV